MHLYKIKKGKGRQKKSNKKINTSNVRRQKSKQSKEEIPINKKLASNYGNKFNKEKIIKKKNFKEYKWRWNSKN